MSPRHVQELQKGTCEHQAIPALLLAADLDFIQSKASTRLQEMANVLRKALATTKQHM